MCPAAMLARASLLLCLVVGSRQLSISELVVPSTVQVGENAELACRFDLGDSPSEALIIKWWFNSTADKEQIYQRIGTGPGEAIIQNLQVKENDTIVLTNVNPTMSGTYECEVSATTADNEEVRKHQDLTVFTPGTGPQLNISVVADGPDEDTEDDVLIECRADDVAPAPDISITINGESLNMTEEVIGPDDKGFYDTMGTATLSKGAVEGATVTCELFYNDTSVKHEPYTATEVYQSGETTTASPEESTDAVITADSKQNNSGDSTAIYHSWVLWLAFSLLTQVPYLHI